MDIATNPERNRMSDWKWHVRSEEDIARAEALSPAQCLRALCEVMTILHIGQEHFSRPQPDMSESERATTLASYERQIDAMCRALQLFHRMIEETFMKPMN
jgi:hypothetical protein